MKIKKKLPSGKYYEGIIYYFSASVDLTVIQT